jgi:hypothetical protein
MFDATVSTGNAACLGDISSFGLSITQKHNIFIRSTTVYDHPAPSRQRGDVILDSAGIATAGSRVCSVSRIANVSARSSGPSRT